MNKHAVKLMQGHYAAVAGELETAVDRFYQLLFEKHPEIRTIFPPDMARQRAHLATAVALVVRNADRLEMLEGPLMEMGARHATYGVKPAHYPIVRDTLLEVLRSVSGALWSPEVEAAWRDALNAVSVAMLKGEVCAAAEAAAKIARPA